MRTHLSFLVKILLTYPVVKKAIDLIQKGAKLTDYLKMLYLEKLQVLG